MSGLRLVLLGLGLDVSGQFTQPGLVRPGVVPAEEELASRGKNGSYLRGSTAPIATVGSGQIGAGECSSHVDLPPSRHRSPDA
jgi:hypothetical protein